MENLNETQGNSNDFVLNEFAIHYFTEMRKWTLFLSILGFIGLGMMVVAAIVLLLFSGLIPGQELEPLTVIPLILIGFVYFFPIYYLYQFSVQSKTALLLKDPGILANALRFLKMHYKFMGILMIVVLIIYLIVIIAAVLGAGFMQSAFTPATQL